MSLYWSRRSSDFTVRIIFLNPVGFVGGAERVLLDVIASLRDAVPSGSTMRLICLSEGPLVDEARALGIKAETMSLPAKLSSLGESGMRGGRVGKAAAIAWQLALASPAGIAYVHRLRKVLDAAQADIIHSNGIKTHLLSRLLPARGGRVVWHVHDLLGDRALLSSVLRHAAGRVSGAVAISQAVANDLKRVLPAVPVFPMLNGIDTEHFSPAPGDKGLLDHLAGLRPAPADFVRVGLVATYARWKGQDLFLESIAKLTDQTKARFYIIGGSIYHTAGSQFSRAELEAKSAALGLGGRVGFIGFQKDTLDVYRALDVVVHASTRPEPFGRTIAEAMACGRAVIVSNAGGAAELFENGRDALGVAPGSADELAASIRSLITDPGHREALATAARATAIARFNRTRLGSEFLAVYTALLEKRRSNLATDEHR